MRRFLLIAASLLISSPVSAQIPLDSVSVTIYDRADLEVTITPRDFRGFSGDTVTFQALVVDGPTGDTLDVDLLWTTDNPQAMTLDAESGFATFRNRGRYNIYVEVVSFRSVQIAMYSQLEGEQGWQELTAERPLGLIVGQRAQLCGYLVGVEVFQNFTDVVPISKSEAICPDIGTNPLPVSAMEWTSSDPSIVCIGSECPTPI